MLAACVLLALGIVALRVGLDGDGEGEPIPAATPTPTPAATAAVAVEVATATALASPTVLPAVAGAPAADGRRVVCLDPGHGGSDRGNVRLENGQIALQEKDFTLAHALALGERLRAQGIEVVFTRTADTEANSANLDVNGDGTVAAPGGEARSDQLDDLQARVNTCNAGAADLLVSVHYNGAENEFLAGYEVWYNDARPFSDRSLRFAELMHEELGARMAAAGYQAVDRGIGVEDHAVTGPPRPGKLVPSAMPGAVVEGLFLSNAEDAAFIVRDGAADAIVTAYEQAIIRYFAEYPG